MAENGKKPRRKRWLRWANFPARDGGRVIDINIARRLREEREAERTNNRPEPPEPRPAAGRAA